MSRLVVLVGSVDLHKAECFDQPTCAKCILDLDGCEVSMHDPGELAVVLGTCNSDDNYTLTKVLINGTIGTVSEARNSSSSLLAEV